MIYGQFTGDRDLRTYYTSLGVDVLDKGERLNMALATGKDIWLTPQPDDTMFVRHFGRGCRQLATAADVVRIFGPGLEVQRS